eukprot:1140119-Pelagomonas_calceolata.AAC.2
MKLIRHDALLGGRRTKQVLDLRELQILRRAIQDYVHSVLNNVPIAFANFKLVRAPTSVTIMDDAAGFLLKSLTQCTLTRSVRLLQAWIICSRRPLY